MKHWMRALLVPLLALCLSLSLWLPARASTLHLTGEERWPLSLDRQVEVLKDATGALTRDDVLAISDDAPEGFRPGTPTGMRPGFTDAAFWLRLELVNDGSAPQSLQLMLNSTWLQHADFHLRKGDAPDARWAVRKRGVAQPYAPGRQPFVAIDLQPGERALVLVRVQTASNLRFAPVLYTTEMLLASEQWHALFDGLLIGGLLVLGVYSLTTWALSRAPAMGWQGAGFILVALYEASYRGYARIFLWPDSPLWSYRAAGSLGPLCAILLVLQLHEITRHSGIRPPGLKVIGALTALQAVIVAGGLLGPYGFFAQAALVTVLALVVALNISGFVYMRRGGVRGKLVFGITLLIAAGIGLRLSEIAFQERFATSFDPYALGFPGMLLGLVTLSWWGHRLARQHEEARDTLLRWQAESQRKLQDEVQRKTRALNSALLQSEAQMHDQTRLMAIVSHDLRAPLATILGHVRLLREELNAGSPTLLQAIERNAGYQLSLIDDLLEYAKGELQPIVPAPQPVDLPALIDDIAQYAATLALRQNNRFTLRCHDTLPPAVRLDSKRFQQLVLNLLSNAAKFTRDGSIELIVAAKGCEKGWSLEIEVADTGIGIDEADQARIFEMFQRADVQFDGHGLGLFIARRIVESMGGKLELHSRAHRGTQLKFALQVEAASIDEVVPRARPVSSSARASAQAAAPASEGQRLEPLPAAIREELAELARDGRWSDLHDRIERLAGDQKHATLAALLRDALERLDFDHVGRLAQSAR
ncbi:ATP-binding protein [Variovorax sp. EL159]|uniref:sensor histidine kinase n=1 Tax=Variovorax sp. EL159 TaxID=1566270 RepID=UPI000B83470E|nr:ATP-binding protein [Variovorax sp. EL159]